MRYRNLFSAEKCDSASVYFNGMDIPVEVDIESCYSGRTYCCIEIWIDLHEFFFDETKIQLFRVVLLEYSTDLLFNIAVG